MYQNLNPNSVLTAAALLASTVALTPDQITALKAEIAKPDYANLTDAQVLNKLNTITQKANPTPPVLRPRTSMPKEEFLHAMSDLLFKVESLPDSEDKAAVLSISATQIPLATAVNNVSLTGLAVQAIFAKLLSLGVVTQAQIDALTSIPDPSYQAQVPTTPASEVVGALVLLDRADLEQVKA